MAASRSTVASTFPVPTFAMSANTWRLRLDTSKRSMSAMASRSIPARASDCTAAPPIPPTPQTKTGVVRSAACSASVTKPALRVVISA